MNIQFIAAALAVASAFVVYGFQAQNSIAFLAAIVMLVASLYYSANSQRELARVGSYIVAIIEPKIDGLQWETMVVEMRKRTKKSYISLSFSFPITISIFALFASACIFFAWWFLRDYLILNVILYTCITMTLGVSFFIVSAYALQCSSKKFLLDRISRWKRLEEELYPTVAATPMKNQQASH